MKRSDLYRILEGIKKAGSLSNTANINFTMDMARLEHEVSKEIQIIDKGKKKVPIKYEEYLKEKKSLDMRFAVQKEDGFFQTLNGNLIVKNPTQYYSELTELDKKYNEAIKEFEKIAKEFEEYIEQEIEITLPRIKKSLFPKETTVEIATLLFPIIDINY